MNTYKGLKVPESAKPSDISQTGGHVIDRMDAHCNLLYGSSFCQDVVCNNCLFDAGIPFVNINIFKQWEEENAK